MLNTENLRPTTLDEMVGQENIKQRLRIAMGAAMQRGEPLGHILLTSSGGGLGKTTLAQIISNEMLCTLHATTGQCISSTLDLKRVLIMLEPSNVLLIDEAHCIGRLVQEELLLVIEQNILNVSVNPSGPVRLVLPPFTLIFASTKPEALSAPLVQRFPLHLHLECYTTDELQVIVRGMTQRMGFELDDDVCAAVARRAKGIPRLGLRLSERVRDVAQARGLARATMNELTLAMQIEGVDDLGLSRLDRQYLRVLAQADPRPISGRSLSLGLGINVATITDVLEGPLVRLGLISIGVGGRRLTEKGSEHLHLVGNSYD